MAEVIHRIISNKFLYDLGAESGILHPILQAVKQDETLSMQIRNNYINIYYMGGNLLKIEPKSNGYAGTMNAGYGLGEYKNNKIRTIKDSEDIVNTFDRRKQAIEKKSGNKNEKKFQQDIYHKNNSGQLIVIDTEVQMPKSISNVLYEKHSSRFDMVAIEPMGNGRYRPIVIENKYSYKCLGGKCGVVHHQDDSSGFINSEYWQHYITELENQAMILDKLGLIKMPDFFFIDSGGPTKSIIFYWWF